jgi:hypothetical protein
MATQPNVDTECFLLAEFVDNAGGANAHALPTKNEATAALREVIRRIASATGVPRFQLDEVVEQVVTATGTEIEGLLRQQIQMVLGALRGAPSSIPDGKRGPDIHSDTTSALPA